MSWNNIPLFQDFPWILCSNSSDDPARQAQAQIMALFASVILWHCDETGLSWISQDFVILEQYPYWENDTHGWLFWTRCVSLIFNWKCYHLSKLFQKSVGLVRVECRASGEAITHIPSPLPQNFICGIIHEGWDVFRHLPVLTYFRPINNHDKDSYWCIWVDKRIAMINKATHKIQLNPVIFGDVLDRRIYRGFEQLLLKWPKPVFTDFSLFGSDCFSLKEAHFLHISCSLVVLYSSDVNM